MQEVGGSKERVVQEVRGSKRLVEQWSERGMVLPEDSIKHVLELSEEEGVTLVHWLTHGIPKPDVLRGKFQVEPSAAGRVVQRLVEEDIRFRINVFPIGIPQPQAIEVEFASEGLSGR